ncbi:hypothetical protein [Sediminicoccus sp. KRV36]|uniref:hypothetical protein n=1 Tax=Sediminicoccus sp. KRV36 TaxID=3133721 RepID=UPI002010AFD9|nr:hypothetical protein [Sediminicoccus rosea]UPY37978.1 hypothetical protein LHU95_04565 [Sediminicoccus rosea]
MVKTFRPAFLTLALLVGAAPAFAQGVSTTPAPASTSTQRPLAAAPATPANPAGQVGTQRPATPSQAQAPARPAQPSGSAATTPAPTAPRTN